VREQNSSALFAVAKTRFGGVADQTFQRGFRHISHTSPTSPPAGLPPYDDRAGQSGTPYETHAIRNGGRVRPPRG
jgi:hypothetical protein